MMNIRKYLFQFQLLFRFIITPLKMSAWDQSVFSASTVNSCKNFLTFYGLATDVRQVFNQSINNPQCVKSTPSGTRAWWNTL